MNEPTRELRIDANHYYCSDIEQGEYLHCKSRMFDYEGGCYARALVGEGFMAVRLDLPDDHPEVVAAREDIGPVYAEHMDIEDIVPIKDLERVDGRPISTWTRSLTDSERAQRAREAGFSRLVLKDLDAGLRGSYKKERA